MQAGSKGSIHVGPYMAQLDGLRAFAVIAVLVSHFWAANWGRLVPWGFLGVRLFFVLSGFLITGILLRGRDAAESGGFTRMGELGRFYARRFLRIFPLYYATVFLMLLLGVPGVREDLGWLLTYTFNLHIVNDGWFHSADKSWFHNDYFHLWSLSVEEQFYLVWPWLVLLSPRRWLVRIIGAAIIAGVAYRYYAMVIIDGATMDTMYMFTVTCLDTLGIGALLALAVHTAPEAKVRRVMSWAVLPVGAVGVVLAHVAAGYKSTWAMYHVFIDTTLALFCCWIIYRASIGFGGVAGRMLELSPMKYLGKISYGIYVYHLFIPALISPLWLRAFGEPFPPMGAVHFFVSSALTIGVAALSWHLMESPINNLKRHFERSARTLPGVPTLELAVAPAKKA